MKRKLKESAGFSLVELMVAALVSMIILTPLAVFFVNGNRMSVHTWDQTLALENAQRVYNEIIDGRKGARTGLRHASEYDVGVNSLAFKVGGDILGYRLESNSLYKVEGLAAVSAPTSGGSVVLANVQSFSVQDDVSTGTLTVSLVTQKPSSTGMRVGGTLSTRIVPRGMTVTAGGSNVPQNLAAVSGADSAALTWDAVAGATGYNLYRSTDGGASYANIASPATNGYTDTGLTAGNEYLYKVTSIVAGSESGFSLVVIGRPGDTTAPAAPTGLAAAAASALVTLTWNANGEADLAGYNIYRATAAGGPFVKVNAALAAGASYTDSGLTNGQTYWYCITAVDDSGNESEDSATVSGLPSLPTPTGLASTGKTSSSVALSWDSVAGVDGYNVYVSTSEGGPYNKNNGSVIAGTAYTVSGLSRNNWYWFKVSSAAGVNESALSGWIKVKTNN